MQGRGGGVRQNHFICRLYRFARGATNIGIYRASCYCDSMSWRIKSEIYVQALVRRVYAAHAAAYVARRGDSDAGGMLIRINRLDGCSGILTMFTDMEGNRGWRVSLAPETADADVDAFLAREIARDPDIWIVEIEDTQGRLFVEEKIEGIWNA